MRTFFPTHPQAAMAIYLAQRLRRAKPDHVANTLRITDVPRKLYDLAVAMELEDCIGHFIDIKA